MTVMACGSPTSDELPVEPLVGEEGPGTLSAPLTPGMAAYDPILKAPRCATVSPSCDTGTLVDGRGLLGPEPNHPNTLGGT